LDEESALGAVVELTNFHSAKAIENDIEKQKKIKGMASYWPGSNVDRLYHCLWRKTDAYRKAVAELQVPYVIAVFGEFTAVVDKEEFEACLLDAESGLFGLYEELSGVLFFEESAGQYAFSYMRNPGALREFSLPAGVFLSR
jgi:hypothetical protein